MKKVIFIVVFSLTMVSAIAQQSVQQEFAKNGEIYFKTEISSSKVLPDLTKMISIDNRDANTIWAYANENEFSNFLDLNLEYKLLAHPNEGFDPLMATFEQIQNSDNWNYYPTYEAYIALMYQFETDYPNLCDVFSIGQSVDGREILVAKISDNVNTDENEPEFFYTSSMHGDELTGYPLMLNLIDSLLANYGSVTRMTHLINNIEIYINPLANPDGTYAGGNSTVAYATRYNANSYDLNRNFPDVVTGQFPNTQTETFHFMNFAESRNFVLSANFHGGAEVVNYPWDHKYAFAADDDWWQFVSHEYADTCQAFSPSNYLNGYNDGITNGAAWYVIDGGRQDYMNYYHQCREFTLEISDTKLIPASQLDDHWEYNRRSVLNYMEQCLYGIRGVVTDAITGEPVKAEIFILNHDIESDSSMVFSELPIGNYHRLIKAGTYDIRVSAPCYDDLIVNGVSVLDYATTIQDIQLLPASNSTDFTVNTTTGVANESFYFTDLSCGNPTSWLWTFTGPGNVVFVEGSSTTSQNPIVQFEAAGSYDVSLTITTSGGNSTETKINYITISDCSYCESTYSNTSDDWITNVTFVDINNDSQQGGTDSYEDFTSVSTNVEPGMSYPISITFEMNGDWHQDCFAFVDWNQDCDFDDTNETTDLGFQQNDGTLSSSILIPSDVQPGNYRFRIVEQYNQDPGACDPHPTVYGETEDYTLVIPATRVNLDLKVFLEGPYNGIIMNTDLTNSTNVPDQQPYNISPWNYDGNESVSSFPPDAVDWILIELHDASTASNVNSSSMVETKAALLLSDGSVVQTDGISLPEFDYTFNDQMFVIIRHHNHLDILSAAALTKIGDNYVYDFTSGQSQAYNGSAGYKSIGSNVFGMVSGDANADGTIDNLDKSDKWETEVGLPGYLSSDLNMDGKSNNQDKNEYWLINTIYSSQAPN